LDAVEPVEKEDLSSPQDANILYQAAKFTKKVNL
jgi:hypothetical protein